VLRRDCWEQQFSPDGKYLACVDHDLGLSVLETQTGKRIFQKKEFAKPNLFELASGNSLARLRFKTGTAFTRFSLDGKKLLVLTSGQVVYAFDTDRLLVKK
jgi:hypothetical protein